MINRITRANSKKLALVHKDSILSYAQLSEEVSILASSINKSEIQVIRQINPIRAIIHLLATASVQGKAIIVSEDFEGAIADVSDSKKGFRLGLLSSGSTGEPKVIWKTNKNWESAFEAQSMTFDISESDNIMVLDALSYSANLNSVLHGMWCGATVHLQELKNAKNWPRYIENNCISSIFLVPSHWNLLLSPEANFLKVKSCITAGEKLSVKQAKGIVERFPNALLTEYYGAAELGHISYQQGFDIINKPHSVGNPFPGVQIRIIEQRIHVKSNYIAPEYTNSGTVNDMGFLDNEGSLVLLGRAGRLFNKRGLNVYAQEIEQVILMHPQVENAYLFQNKRSKLELVYCLQEQIRNEVEEKELWQLIDSKLPQAKRPHFLRRVKELPINNHGKISIGQLNRTLDEEAMLM